MASNVQPRRSFTLWQALEIVFWIAVALAAIRSLATTDDNSLRYGTSLFWPQLLMWVPGIALGAAVGAIKGKRLKWAVIGAFLFPIGLAALAFLFLLAVVFL